MASIAGNEGTFEKGEKKKTRAGEEHGYVLEFLTQKLDYGLNR